MGQNLFTYGTLMVPELFVKLTNKPYPTCKAVLKDFARYKVNGKSYPGIIPEKGGAVEGMVYLEVTSGDLIKLDRFEGEMYSAEEVIVKTETGTVMKALVYVVKPNYKDQLSREEWSMTAFVRDHLKTFL